MRTKVKVGELMDAVVLLAEVQGKLDALIGSGVLSENAGHVISDCCGDLDAVVSDLEDWVREAK